MMASDVEQWNITVDMIKKAGIINKFGGNIFVREISMALLALRYTSPLQHPMEKLLNHKMTGGIGQRNFVTIAGSIINIRMKLDTRAEKNILPKPAALSVKLASSREERYSLFSYDRFVLKNIPANRPVIKMNMNIVADFFISMSPFIYLSNMTYSGPFGASVHIKDMTDKPVL